MRGHPPCARAVAAREPRCLPRLAGCGRRARAWLARFLSSNPLSHYAGWGDCWKEGVFGDEETFGAETPSRASGRAKTRSPPAPCPPRRRRRGQGVGGGDPAPAGSVRRLMPLRCNARFCAFFACAILHTLHSCPRGGREVAHRRSMRGRTGGRGSSPTPRSPRFPEGSRPPGGRAGK